MDSGRGAFEDETPAAFIFGVPVKNMRAKISRRGNRRENGIRCNLKI
jgi:hypothetical protein